MAEARPKSDHQVVMALMHALGCKDGYNPLPPSQHKWLMDPGAPPLYRSWGWMLDHTIHWGHRSAYAVKRVGDQLMEMHIEHMANDLGMDLPNQYLYWRKLAARGVVRNGSAEEGPRRLYLTGKVPRFKAEESEKLYVHTIFSPHILKQIKDWEPERVAELRKSLEEEIELLKAVQSALVAANRAVFIDRENTILTRYGVNPARQKHQKKQESAEDAENRRRRIEPIRAPIQEYVQTIREFVQSAPKPQVQTTEKERGKMQKNLTNQSDAQKNTKGSKDAASLSYAQSKNQRSSLSGRSDSVRDSRSSRTHHEGEKPAYNQYLAGKPEALSPEEQKAVDSLFENLALMQRGIPHLNTSNLIAKDCLNDRLLVFRILSEVGVEHVDQFITRAWHSLKTLASKGSNPVKSLGLILHWAKGYREQMDEFARVQAAEEQRWLRRQIDCCIGIINDPAETGDAKYLAKQFLEEHADHAAA